MRAFVAQLTVGTLVMWVLAIWLTTVPAVVLGQGDGATITTDESVSETTAEGGADTGDGADSGDAASADGDGQNTGTASEGAGGGGDGTPWSGTQATPDVPDFLKAQDTRIVDERPPPTPEQIAALKELEAEVARLEKRGAAHRDTINSLVKRQYLRQRRARSQWYSRQIHDEEKRLDEARENAILQFERFIRRYPDDPRYTPDAMFRLGELYYERAQIVFSQSYDAAQESGQEVSLFPDFSETVTLYRELIRRFPDYARLDGVYYLIGYCLKEMGDLERALLAWRALVCANKYTFDDAAFAPPPEEGAGEEGEVSPALSLDPEPAPTVANIDTYDGCEPVKQGARFVSETWFRIGEYHFDDYGVDNALEDAISAYGQILKDEDDKNYGLALYKVAWAYYRANKFEKSIESFAQLVKWSDKRKEETGQEGSDLRPEAIQYLGISFAYDDWNDNTILDPDEGLPRGIERVQDPNLLDQNASFTAEVYFQLGQVYFDEAKFPEAIEAWELAIKKFPDHPLVPVYTNEIAVANERHNQFQEAMSARELLTSYREGSDWWEANKDDPSAQRKAEELAENALIATALFQHEEAQRLRGRCVSEEDVSLCLQAKEKYGIAADGYRGYIKAYPNSPNAYELMYNLADALYWSERYEEAAVQYAMVRDSNLDDTHLSESARRVVESLKRLSDMAIEDGSLSAREEPPVPQGNPPTVQRLEMPVLLQRIAQARETYITRVPEEQDKEGVRAPYAYNNALLLYWYGYWPEAKERFEAVFNERCSGANANETGRIAWESLLDMSIALNDSEESRRLTNELKEKNCTFNAGGETCPTGEAADAFCGDPKNAEHFCCRADAVGRALEFKDANAIFKQAEAASGEEQVRLYEKSATMLVEAVNRTPNHEQAPLALELAATALERTQRFDSAGQLYQRIIDDVGPMRPKDPARAEQLDRIVGNAYFKVGYSSERSFDFRNAVKNYSVLADDSRFARSSDDRVREMRVNALVNTARLYQQLQDYKRATAYYRRVYDTTKNADDKRIALYSIAEMAYEQKNWNVAVREMRAFINKYERDSKAGELVVKAYWRIAQARKAAGQTRDYKTALADVVKAFKRTGQPAGKVAAEYAAHAQFVLVDEDIAEFEKFAIKPGKPKTLEAYIKTIGSQMETGKKQATKLRDGYNSVLPYQRPVWAVAAFVRSGRVYEILAKGILNTPFVMPADLAKKIRGASRDAKEDVRIQVEDALRMKFDEWTRPVECKAVERYALASRAAVGANIDNEYTQQGIDRLQAYGEERIAECLASSEVQGYRSGEFQRSPRGMSKRIDSSATSAPAGQ